MTSLKIENAQLNDEVFYENQFGVEYDCKVREIKDNQIILDNNAIVDHKGRLVNVTPRTLVFRRQK